MGKIFKTGRVVVMTSGRYAGKKALVAKVSDDGNKKYKFPHLLVVGIARNPKKVQRRINKKRFLTRTQVKPFVKYVNQNHVMPTRYLVTEFDLKSIKDDNLKTQDSKTLLKKELRKTLSEQYRNLPNPKTNEKAGNIRFFYQRLRF